MHLYSINKSNGFFYYYVKVDIKVHVHLTEVIKASHQKLI